MKLFFKTFVALVAALVLGQASPCVPAWADRSHSASTRPEDVERARKLARLWDQRFTRDVSEELLPFLDDPSLELRERAVRALGRLEKPDVLPELEKRRDAQKAAIEAGRTDLSKRPRNEFDFDTAIARIKSWDLHGKEKIEFVLHNMKPGWTWEEAVKESKRLKDPDFFIGRPHQQRQLLARPVRDIVDLLYTMSKNGENIEPFRQQLTFSKAQNAQLDGAKLSLDQEAEHILDYTQTLDIVSQDDEYVCESHFLSLGEPARVALSKRMRLLLHTKPKFTNANPFICMLRASAMTGDASFLPLIKEFAVKMDYVEYTAYFAEQAKDRLQGNDAYIFAPQ